MKRCSLKKKNQKSLVKIEEKKFFLDAEMQSNRFQDKRSSFIILDRYGKLKETIRVIFFCSFFFVKYGGRSNVKLSVEISSLKNI